MGWNAYIRTRKVPIMILALFLMAFVILLAAFRTSDSVLIIAFIIFLMGAGASYYSAKLFMEE